MQWKGDGNITLWGMRVDIVNNAMSQNGGKEAYEGTGEHYNYVYDRPVGGTSSPYRLQDFCGYYPEATGIYIQNIAMGETETLYITNTATETKDFTFAVFGSTHANAVKFSDIEEVARLDSNYHLRLVVSVYVKGTDTLINEYFNNGIPLWTNTSASVDDTYDSDEMKKASISFSKSEYWGDGVSEIDVYLSLQTIKKDSSQYMSDKIIALPYSNDRYFKKTIKFSVFSRYVRATKIHMGTLDGSTRNWVTISSSNTFNYPGSGTPDIMFEVNKVPNETLTFQNGVCFLRSKHLRMDGGTTVVSGTLNSESGSNVPGSVVVPSGTSGIVNVYYHFGDMLQEPEYYNNKKLTSGVYPCDIYLVKVSNGVETEVKVDTVPMYINVPG